MMSRIAPRVQRTIFVSAFGGNWKCIPRRVPAHVVEGDVRLGDHGLEAVIGELVLAERAGEVATRVLPPLQVDQERAGQCRLGEDHVPSPRSGQAPTAPTGACHRSSASSRPCSSKGLQPREPDESVAREHRLVHAGGTVGIHQLARAARRVPGGPEPVRASRRSSRSRPDSCGGPAPAPSANSTSTPPTASATISARSRTT